MSNHPATGAPTEPPRRKTTTNYPIPAHDPSQDQARALQGQIGQHQQVRTSPIPPGGALQTGNPCDPEPDDPGTP